MSGQRWSSWNKKKQSRDKRFFKRIFTIESPSIFYYMLHLPVTLIRIVYRFARDEDFYKAWADMKDVNAIRKVTYNYKKTKGMLGEKIYLATYCHKRYLEVRIYFKRKMKELEYEQFAQNCTVVTGLQRTEVQQARGYYYFTLFGNFDPEKHMYMDDRKIAIGTCPHDKYYWIFEMNPHLIITGVTGSGKTNTLRIIVDTIIDKGYEISMVDEKGTDYVHVESKLSHYMNTTDNTFDEIMDVVREFEDKMDERRNILRNQQKEKYYEVGLTPYFLVFEEFSSFVSKVPTKTLKDFFSYLSRVLQKGRSLGANVIICMQRPDTSIIPGELRSNITTRAICGASEDVAYGMLFDVTGLKKLDRGYAWVKQGVDLQVVSVPLYNDLIKEVS